MVVHTGTFDQARGLDRRVTAYTGRDTVARSVIRRSNARAAADVSARVTSPVVGIALLLVFAITSALGLGPIPLLVAGAAVLAWTFGFARRLSVRDPR